MRKRFEREDVRRAMTHDTVALMDRLDGLLTEVVTRLPARFPWG
jgi:hypothetical protein